MNIYISLDAEGCTSLTRLVQVDPNHPEYPKCIEAMSNDIKCVLKGAIDAGAERIVVCDAHESGSNLPLDISIDTKKSKVEFVRGHGTHMSMLQELTEEFDAAMFVGYHARRGSGGVMEHTYFPTCVYEVRIAGKPVGEFTINAYLASEIGVPVVMVTGDETVCEEATELFSNIKTVPVKRAVTCANAICYDKTSVNNRLVDASFAAISMAENKSYSIVEDIPKEIEVAFFNSGQAELASLVPKCTRLAPDKVLYTGDTFKEVYKAMLAGMYLADSFRD